MLKVFYTDHFEVELPQGHRFPMYKYRKLREELIQERILSPNQLIPTELREHEILYLAHQKDYSDRARDNQLSAKEERLIGFPQSYEMYLRSLASICATVSAAEHAWLHGISATISGGTHHAYYDRGEGFCVFNDVAVAIQFMKKKKRNLKAFVIDLDVHQGNGTAVLFQNDPNVFTFSIHGEKNYPFRKEISDFDLALPQGTNDSEYLFQLNLFLLPLIEKHQPDILFYNAGVDILKEDKLGSLNISLNGCYERDLTVLSISKKLQIPIVVVMGGGYANPIDPTISAQKQLFSLIKDFPSL